MKSTLTRSQLPAIVWLVFCAVASATVGFEADPHRLDPRVQPVTQSLELVLDPAADVYRGRARVELQFDVATNLFRFHALEIDLGKATLDGQSLSLAAGEKGIVSATATAPVAAGLHVFEIGFTNNFNRDGTGLYKTVFEGRPYLFTQMAPVDARRAFPCWDEPGFKIPWRLTLNVPRELEVVANLPAAQISEAGGRKILEFGRTPPMPAYLVALAVGPFEFVPIPGQSVPGRIVTAAGKTGLANMAAKEAPALLGALERYFGVPHPFPKLDHIAVPEFNFGAMENVGAITYRDSILLLDPGNSGVGQRRGLIEIVAHEMAHMWFGNLVTMQWWDDVWLNEAFATWASCKVAGQVHPDLRFDLQVYGSSASARYNDTRPSVKPIRRPFRGGDNLMEAFDTLSYLKGQAILSMIEGWIGPEAFQSALRRYFVRHRWGNTRADDLWAALAEGGDDSLRETLRRYIEQPGIPELTFSRLPGNRLQVRQRRYRTLTAKGISEQVWQVPIMLRHGDSSGAKTVRLLLKGEEEIFAVDGLDRAGWIHPNAGESGHYLWSLPPELSSALSQRTGVPLSTTERLGLLSTAEFAMSSGNLPAEELLRLVLGYSDDPETEVRLLVAGTIVGFAEWFSREDRPRYAALLRKVLRPMLDRVGFEPKPGETAEMEQLREILLYGLGNHGGDPEVIAFCRQAALRQFADARSVPASIAAVALGVAAWHGDEAWSLRLRKAIEQAADADVRHRFLGGLTACRDPALVRAGLDYGLTEAVRSTEFQRLLYGERELAAVRFEWLVGNYAAVKKKIPGDRLPFLVGILDAGDGALFAKGREFFLDPSRRNSLTELKLTEVSDAIELETALRDRHGAALKKFVEEQLDAMPGK